MSRENTTVEVVAQSTIILPFLDDVVPALHGSDGRPYIPVCAVCQIFGIRADTHIQRWRKLLFWQTALKLPYQTKRGKRLVWCLLISEIPFLYGLFRWDHLPPARRAQLDQAALEGMKLVNSAYEYMQEQYKMTRETLFSLLISCADIDERLDRQLLQHLPSFDQGTRAVFVAQVSQGRAVHHQVADHARHMLSEQNALPIVDVVTLDAENMATHSFSLPLLPIVPHEDQEQLVALLYQLASWYQEMAAFWRAQSHDDSL